MHATVGGVQHHVMFREVHAIVGGVQHHVMFTAVHAIVGGVQHHVMFRAACGSCKIICRWYKTVCDLFQYIPV